MNEEMPGRWWCPKCEAERSPQQVNHYKLCVECNVAVEWQEECPDCDGAGHLGVCRDGRKQSCEKCGGDEDTIGEGFIG